APRPWPAPGPAFPPAPSPPAPFQSPSPSAPSPIGPLRYPSFPRAEPLIPSCPAPPFRAAPLVSPMPIPDEPTDPGTMALRVTGSLAHPRKMRASIDTGTTATHTCHFRSRMSLLPAPSVFTRAVIAAPRGYRSTWNNLRHTGADP